MNKDPWIRVRGACQNNLDNVDLDIPQNALTAFSGPSGSGKSSLAFQTLFAEGQRRYVESLSVQSKQLLGRLERPHVDSIQGLCPTVSLSQDTTAVGRRSTVGTLSEISDFLRVLFARLGTARCPVSGQKLESTSPHSVVQEMMGSGEGARIHILAPFYTGQIGGLQGALESIGKRGFNRVRLNGEIQILEEVSKPETEAIELQVVVDRVVVRPGREARFTDSVEMAYSIGKGLLMLEVDGAEPRLFTERPFSPETKTLFPELSPQMFSFNGTSGMCQVCQGLGTEMKVDVQRLIPDTGLSLRDGAIATWRKREGGIFRFAESVLNALEENYGVEGNTPFHLLPDHQVEYVLRGVPDGLVMERDRDGQKKTEFRGAANALLERWRESRDSQEMSRLERFMTSRNCEGCGGSRLSPFSSGVTLENVSYAELNRWPLSRVHSWISGVELEGSRASIGQPVLAEIDSRLTILSRLGLDYLSLDRTGNSLSGGERQKLRLASQLGGQLTGILYVLDEPSAGLHPKDTSTLLGLLCDLRDKGNTVIVVEHDLRILKHADFLVDFGPGGGPAGGRVMHAGSVDEATVNPDSPTGPYLSGKMTLSTDVRERQRATDWVTVQDANLRNLKGDVVRFPVGQLIGVCGVSGAGKSTLIHDVLYPAIASHCYGPAGQKVTSASVSGIESYQRAIRVDQSPIGRSPRSNAATYTQLFDVIRKLFAETPEAKAAGYGPGRFSSNVRGGRCEECKGAGLVRVSMVLMPDVFVTCDTCEGRRFNPATLRVKFKGYSIDEILRLPVVEALPVFASIPKARKTLELLHEVGLGYLTLGQPAASLSGGEAQRVKLARELARGDGKSTLYLLDEPATGLHAGDVTALLRVLVRLVQEGNTVVIVEHNVELLKGMDWLVELGPEGGENGGHVLFSGTPQGMSEIDSPTARYLSPTRNESGD